MATALHNCQLDIPDLLDNKNINPITRFIKKWTLVNKKYALHSLCFRTIATIKTEKERHFHLKYFVIHPFSRFRCYWEFFMSLVYLASFIFIPIEACNYFYTQINEKHYVNYGIPMLLMHAIFFIDIFLYFVTGYVESKGKKIILDRRLIALRYIKSYFFVDTLASIPATTNALYYYFLVGEPFCSSLIILNMLKLIRIITYKKYANKLIHSADGDRLCLKISHFLLKSVLFFHWAACLVLIIPFTFTTVTPYSANTWLHKMESDIQVLSTTELYLYSLFTSINYLLTCAATTKSLNMIEFFTIVLYAILGMLYTCFLFIRLLDMIRSIMEPETKYDEFITQLRDYMRHNQLPSNIQQRMYLFYEHRYQRTFFREEAIMNTLSGRICQDINNFGCRKMMSKVSLFNDLDPSIIKDIVDQFILKVYLPKDVICKASVVCRYIYFLSYGTVAVYTVSGKEICHLHDGAYFGDLALLMKDHKMIASVIALEICEVYLLDRDVFGRVVASNPEVYEQVVERAKQGIKLTKAIEATQRHAFPENILGKSEMVLVN